MEGKARVAVVNKRRSSLACGADLIIGGIPRKTQAGKKVREQGVHMQWQALTELRAATNPGKKRSQY